MNQALAVTQRPNSFAEMVGQESIVAAVRKLKTRRTWLITGPPGAGKTTLARICGLSYQEKGEFGAPSPRLLMREASYAIHEVNGANYTGVEAMRELIDIAEYVPDEPSLQRIIIIDEAHRLSAAAQDVLLKPTEDVPAHMRWYFCTNEPHKIKEAIRRRCVTVALNPLTDADRKTITLNLKRATGFKGKVGPFIKYANEMGTVSAGLLTVAFDMWSSGIALNKAFVDLSQLDAQNVCRCIFKADWRGASSLLAKMDAEAIKQLRYMIMAWLKNSLMRSEVPTREAKAIQLMAPVVAYEDPVAAAEISGRIFTLCQVFAARP